MDTKRKIENFERLTESNPNDYILKREYANFLLKIRAKANIRKIEFLLNDIINNSNNNTRSENALFTKIKFLIDSENYTDAENLLNEVTDRTAEWFYTFGYLKEICFEMESAKEAYKEVINRDNKKFKIRSYKRLIEIQIDEKDYKSARETINKFKNEDIWVTNFDLEMIYALSARIYRETNQPYKQQFEMASANYYADKDIKDGKPLNNIYLIELAKIHELNEEYDEAKKIYLNFKTDSFIIEGYYNMALLEEKLGNKENSNKCYQKMIETRNKHKKYKFNCLDR